MTNGFSPSAKRTRNNDVIPDSSSHLCCSCCSLRRRKVSSFVFFLVFFFCSWRWNQTDHIPNLNLIDLTATPNNYRVPISKTASSCSARGDISTTTTKIFWLIFKPCFCRSQAKIRKRRGKSSQNPLYICVATTVHCIRIFLFLLLLYASRKSDKRAAPNKPLILSSGFPFRQRQQQQPSPQY